MLLRRSTLQTIVFSIMLLATSASQAAILTFDEDPTFTHGSVVNSQYAGVTISAFNNARSFNHAVAFNSDLNNTRDEDLEATFTSEKGLGDLNPHNILIIQENRVGCNPGPTCSRPDDEANGGILTFQFDDIINLLSIDFFDIEHDENGQNDSNRIRLFSDTAGNNELAVNYWVPDTSGIDGIGDNHWDRLEFGQGVSGVRRIDVHFEGSGALDNIRYNVVPIPASIWLFGTALLGFIGLSRRTSV